MKAIVFDKYGLPDVLKLQDLEKPMPKDDEVLVRVHASSPNPAEWYAMKGILVARPSSGWLKPKDTRIGADYAGVVEAVGKDVKEFKVGDEVYGGRSGAFAEYVTVRNIISLKPKNITFEQAGVIATAGATALQGLRDYGRLRPGQNVLITGAAGGIGHMAVQMAKAMGATVTAVCRTENVEFVRSLGADHVLDYTREDYTQIDRRYDLILDIASTKSWGALKRILKPTGLLVLVGAPGAYKPLGPLGQIVRLMLHSVVNKGRIRFFVTTFKREDFNTMREMVEDGKMTPFIERTYPLTEVADAMRHLGTGHTRGKVAISMMAKK